MSLLICSRQARLRPLSRWLLIHSKSGRHASTKTLPRAVPSSRAAPRAAPPLKSAKSTSNPVGIRGGLSPLENRKLFAAQKLYEKGLRNIYTAPSQVGILFTSWLLATLLVGKALSMALDRYDKLREGHGLSWLKKGAVEAASRLSMVFLTLVGAYAVVRYRGLIKSLDLIRTGNNVELRVSVRRIIPFLKSREYLIPPYDLRLPQNWRLLSEPEVEFGPMSSSREVGRMLSWPFKKLKKYITMDGILAAHFEEGERRVNGLLDVSGKFTGNMTTLEAISSETRPWD